MAASRAGFSIPTLDRNLLSEFCKISLSSYSRRDVCAKCERQHNLMIGKSNLISKKDDSKCSNLELSKRHYMGGKSCLHQSSFNEGELQNLPQKYTTTINHTSISAISFSSFHNHHRYLHSSLGHSLQLSKPLSNMDIASLPCKSATSFFSSNLQAVRSFHFKTSQAFSLSSSSSFSTSSSHTDIPDQTTNTATLDPFKMMETEMKEIMTELKQELKSPEPLLQHMSQYYFNGKGKTFRPLVALLMARTCNIHSGGDHSITWQQKIVAMVSEMIHTASLVHDDVIDAADTRRNQKTLYMLYGQRPAVLTGDYILSQASIAVSRTSNKQVIKILSTILVDLINGEFMQLGSKEDANERFAHYFDKTYKKTASLIANCCKSVAILGNCDDEVAELCFQYGRNLGLAFQLIDDLLDFTACHSDMGKPTENDLKAGLATAPVLFAAQEYPELHPMIMRRFSQEGDVEFARNAVDKSDGIEQTLLLATQHSNAAIKNVQTLTDSEARQGLIRIAQILLERKS